MPVLAIVVVGLAAVLFGCWLLDRRARRRGHRLRGAQAEWADIREAERDARAWLPTDNDASWTDSARRNRTRR